MKRVIMSEFYKEIDSRAIFGALKLEATINTADEFVQHVNKSLVANSTALFSFAQKIIYPKAIHTLHYIIFILGPAYAVNETSNIGLQLFFTVISNSGKSTNRTHEVCYEEEDDNFEQRVSMVYVPQ